MLNIQVLGRGLIPRGLGLAPRKEFFKADHTLVATIIGTPGLTVNTIDPKTSKIITINKDNLKTVWAKYRTDKPVSTDVAPVAAAPVNDRDTRKFDAATVAPVVNNTSPKPEVVEPKVDVKDEEVKPVVTPEKVVEETVAEDAIKPVVSDNNNNNHNKYNNNKNRH